jgi:hypothetical protein
MPIELLTMAGGAITGFIFRYMAERAKERTQLYEIALGTKKAELESADAAAKRVPVEFGRPQLLPTPSVEANKSPINPSAAGEITPFEPTVSEAEIKLPPVKILVKDLKSLNNKDNLLPVLVDSDGQEYSLTPTVSEEAPKMKVDWIKLVEFYLGTAVFLALIYWGYKMYRKKVKKNNK